MANQAIYEQTAVTVQPAATEQPGVNLGSLTDLRGSARIKNYGSRQQGREAKIQRELKPPCRLEWVGYAQNKSHSGPSP
jgi:hypothetical protein